MGGQVGRRVHESRGKTSAARALSCLTPTNLAHQTWKNNPRLKLVAQQSGSVQLLLTLPSGDATGIGILISRKADQPDRGDLVGESELLMGEEVGMKFDVGVASWLSVHRALATVGGQQTCVGDADHV